MSELTVKSISKKYGNKTVLSDVSLKLSRGEVVALLGPNGAGKTSLFYIIVGLISSNGGAISLNGSDITYHPVFMRARKGIGYLPQESSIFRDMTVEENILAVLEIKISDKKEREKRLNKLLKEFSITKLRKAKAVTLSGGERRRVEIARCLASDPEYVLLDEPFAGVDPIAVGDIRILVQHLKDRNIGVLITDHNVRETLEIVDRAYIIYDGRVLMSGTAEEITTNKKVKKLYLGENFKLS